jgi:hypothetical protein
MTSLLESSAVDRPARPSRNYIFAQLTPRHQQNQWVMSRTDAETVEDGSKG